MLWKQVSPHAAQCCEALWQAGFEAYPVGGCVRDLLLGRTPGDWDVTTSALPEQVITLFDHVITTGVKHGTVTVILGDEHLEVTTFRAETGYSDGRHPDKVCFDATLEEDLSRRDFTMNAMALGRDGEIIDLFGGQEDLKKGIIRCVGDPTCRFKEDGLRMFRAVRFGAQLGFGLTPETKQAIRGCSAGAEQIAAERVRVEVEKTLCSQRPEFTEQFFRFGLMTRWAQGQPEELCGLERLPAEPLLRWARLCAQLMVKGCIVRAENFLRGLKLDGATIRACEAGWELCGHGLAADDAGWRRLLVDHGKDSCRAAAAMAGEEALRQLGTVLEQDPCVRMEQLALSGGNLFDMGLRGPQIGRVQRYLLEYVSNHPEDNRAEILKSKLQEFLGRL